MKEQNLGFEFHRVAQKHPNRLAFESEQIKVTYAQMEHAVVCYALHMQARGITDKSLVALWTKETPVAMAVYFAVALLGASWISLHPKEVQQVGPNVTHYLFSGTPSHGAINHENAHVLDETWMQPPVKFAQNATVNFPGHNSHKSPFVYFTSSGTTGPPKFMQVNYENAFVFPADRKLAIEAYRDGIRAVTLFSNTNAGAFVRNLPVFLNGGTVVQYDTFDEWVAAKTDIVFASLAQLAAVLPDKNMGGNRLPTVCIGGSKITEKLQRYLSQFFKKILIDYGAMEVGVARVSLFDADGPHIESIGEAIPNVDVEIVDDDHQPLPFGTQGQVRIRSRGMVKGYLGERELTAKSFSDGWFFPGDVGEIAENGELFLHGRTNDLLNFGGVKINALQLDEIVQAVAGVEDGVICSFPNETGIERVGVVVQLEEGHTEAETKAAILTATSAELFKHAKPVVMLFVDAVPRNENGKVQRHVASEMAAEFYSKNGSNV